MCGARVCMLHYSIPQLQAACSMHVILILFVNYTLSSYVPSLFLLNPAIFRIQSGGTNRGIFAKGISLLGSCLSPQDALQTHLSTTATSTSILGDIIDEHFRNFIRTANPYDIAWYDREQ